MKTYITKIKFKKYFFSAIVVPFVLLYFVSNDQSRFQISAQSKMRFFTAKYQDINAIFTTQNDIEGYLITDRNTPEQASQSQALFKKLNLPSNDDKYFKLRYQGKKNISEISDPQLLLDESSGIEKIDSFEYNQNHDAIYLSVPENPKKNNLYKVTLSNKSVDHLWPKPESVFDGGHHVHMHLIRIYTVDNTDYAFVLFGLYAQKGNHGLLINTQTSNHLKLRNVTDININYSEKTATYKTSYQSPLCRYNQTKNLPIGDECQDTFTKQLP